MPFRLEIVTPEERTFSADVDLAVIPGSEGELGVLPGHTALVTTMIPGELRYTKDGEEHELAVGQGVVEVMREQVSVLTDLAIREADIDEAAVQAALERAQKALKEKLGDEEIAVTQAAIQKSLVQLRLKRKRRKQI